MFCNIICEQSVVFALLLCFLWALGGRKFLFSQIFGVHGFLFSQHFPLFLNLSKINNYFQKIPFYSSKNQKIVIEYYDIGTYKYSARGELQEIFVKYDGNNRRRFDREKFLEVTDI